MSFFYSVRKAPGVRSAAAVACGAMLSWTPCAWADDALEPVVVTATRFAENAQAVAANVTVITRADIRAIPGQSVPDILKMAAGVDVRPTYGALGIDATVDVGGFGATATSNTLILVDGQRLNPIDMGSVIWSSIPKESIQRIEIIRGSGSVLFGNGASGGVINIITDKSQHTSNSVSATLGSFGHVDSDVHLAGQSTVGYLNATAHHAQEDGYRQNNQQSEDSLSGRGGIHLSQGEAFVDYTVYQDSNGLPGGLGQAAYVQDPTGAKTLEDSQHRNGYRIRPGTVYRLSDQLELNAEVAVEHQELKGDYVSYGSASDRVRDTTSFTPRLRWQHGLDGLFSETVLGLDVYDGTVSSDNIGFANQTGGQSSTSMYVQNVTRLNTNLSVTLGERMQRVRQDAWQAATTGAYAMPAMNGSGTHTEHAYDVGMTYAQDNWRVFGKTGTTFRFANIDELFGYDPNTGNPVFAGDVRPQHGMRNEIGASLTSRAFTFSGSLYQLNLKDEIGYDGLQFANVNLDPTRRRGIDAEVSWKADNSWTMKLAYSYLDARFTSGAYADNTLPLAPHNQASLLATWSGGSLGDYSAMVRYVGSRYYDSDFGHTAGALPAYTTLDLQAGWDFKPWRFTVKLLNAFDRQYAPEALYSAGTSKYAYYPADGRALFASAQYRF